MGLSLMLSPAPFVYASFIITTQAIAMEGKAV